MDANSGSLRKRITRAILAGISIILLSFGIVSNFIIRKNIDDSLSKRLVLSRLVRNNIDNIITDNINRLYDISLSGAVDLNDNTFEPEKSALKSAYQYSLFTGGIFLLDRGGNVILNHPERIQETALNVLSIEPISRMIGSGKPVVSNMYTLPTGKKVLYVLVPLKDRHGRLVGAAGGEIDPTNQTLIQKLGLADVGKDMFVDIVDANGVVISSSDPGRYLTQCNRGKFFSRNIAERKEQVATCHVCHLSQDETRVEHRHNTVLAFVPLNSAPWGIAIQEPEAVVFASSVQLKWTLLALGFVFIGTAFLLTIGINRSIVDPLKALIRGADRIAGGELTVPILHQGSDEIGRLSQSFETMRLRLIESMEHITRHTAELEMRVQERTRQIRESRQRVQVLLEKVITTQEDERKRLGRELHDDTLQELSAALMRIDMCRLHPDHLTLEKIDSIRGIITKALDSLVAIIQNLRPTLLDDLGLIAAIKSLLEMHLGERGIRFFFNTTGVEDRRFRPEVETTLFRTIQEAVVNIARHAQAEKVFIEFKIENNEVHMEIEDDGKGFNCRQLFGEEDRIPLDRRGLGLLGMKERITLIGGTFELCSGEGQGTHISVRIPLAEAEVAHA